MIIKLNIAIQYIDMMISDYEWANNVDNVDNIMDLLGEDLDDKYKHSYALQVKKDGDIYKVTIHGIKKSVRTVIDTSPHSRRQDLVIFLFMICSIIVYNACFIWLITTKSIE